MNILTFDVETDSLDVLSAKLIGIAYKLGDSPAVYTHDKELVYGLIEEADLVIAHNAKFDLAIMGYPKTKAIYDTMVAEWLLYPDQKMYGLKKLTKKYFNVKQTSYNELIQKFKPHNKKIKECTLDIVPSALIEQYCKDDVDWTYQLYGITKKKLEETGAITLFNELEMPFLPVLMDMERNGIKFNHEPIKCLSSDLNVRLNELQAQINELAGAPINLSNKQEVSDLLFFKLGLPYTKRKKKCNKGANTLFSTEAEELGKMKHMHPILPLLLEHSKLSKVYSTYTGTLSAAVRRDGRIHCSFNQIGTSTGRLSSDTPNLQNIPSKGEYGKLIRQAFQAEEGKLLVAFDYNQMELRILAGLAEDDKMLNVYSNGGDIHKDTAQSMYGKEDITDEERASAKTVNFGIIYGMTAFGLAKKLECEERTAQHFIYKYACQWSKAWFFRKEKIKEVEQKLKTETLFGRVRNLDKVMGNIMTRAVNTPVQGTAADLVKLAMIRLHKVLNGTNCKLVLQVHDELVYEIPKEEVDKYVPIIKAVMESVNISKYAVLKCPMVVDVEMGDTWNFKKEE